MSDWDRACALFASRAQQVGGAVVGPAIHEDALQLLGDDPAEYFRLLRIWRDNANGIYIAPTSGLTPQWKENE